MAINRWNSWQIYVFVNRCPFCGQRRGLFKDFKTLVGIKLFHSGEQEVKEFNRFYITLASCYAVFPVQKCRILVVTCSCQLKLHKLPDGAVKDPHIIQSEIHQEVPYKTFIMSPLGKCLSIINAWHSFYECILPAALQVRSLT